MRRFISKISNRTLALVTLGVLHSFPVSAGAVTGIGQWHDRYYGKDWTLVPREDEIVVRYKRGTTQTTRSLLVASENLIESHPYANGLRVAVYHVSGGANSRDKALRLSQNAAIAAVAPAAVDQEGYTRYYVPDLLKIQLDRTLSDSACQELIRASGSEIVLHFRTPGYYCITIPSGVDLFQAIRSWYLNPQLLFAEPAYIGYDDALYSPNDEHFGKQWYLANTRQANFGVLEADVQAKDA